LRAGLLALPRVFALLGIGTATIWLIFTAALTYLSMHMLTKATVRTGLLNYRQAGTAGPAGWLEACWMCCQRLPGGWHLSLLALLKQRAAELALSVLPCTALPNPPPFFLFPLLAAATWCASSWASLGRRFSTWR
jgi:hypothetical protein